MAVTCARCSMSVDWWVRLRTHPDLRRAARQESTHGLAPHEDPG